MDQKSREAIFQIRRTIKEIKNYSNDYYYANAFESYVNTLNQYTPLINFPPFDFKEYHYSATKKTINDTGYISLIYYVDLLEEELPALQNKQDDVQSNKKYIDETKVFIVHGRDKAILTETELLLKNAGLNPIVLSKQANSGLTLMEKFEKYSDVSYAIILLTPDDIGSYFEKDTHPNLQYRARQNVIFELGFFYGKLGRSNVCCLLKQSVEKPSDLDGIAYIPFTESIDEIEYDILKELRESNLKVKI